MLSRDEILEKIVRRKKLGMPTFQIAEELNKEGIVTGRGFPFKAQTITDYINYSKRKGRFKMGEDNQDSELDTRMMRLRAEGVSSRQIAEELNTLGFKSPTGKSIDPTWVSSRINYVRSRSRLKARKSKVSRMITIPVANSSDENSFEARTSGGKVFSFIAGEEFIEKLLNGLLK